MDKGKNGIKVDYSAYGTSLDFVINCHSLLGEYALVIIKEDKSEYTADVFSSEKLRKVSIPTEKLKNAYSFKLVDIETDEIFFEEVFHKLDKLDDMISYEKESEPNTETLSLNEEKSSVSQNEQEDYRLQNQKKDFSLTDTFVSENNAEMITNSVADELIFPSENIKQNKEKSFEKSAPSENKEILINNDAELFKLLFTEFNDISAKDTIFYVFDEETAKKMNIKIRYNSFHVDLSAIFLGYENIYDNFPGVKKIIGAKYESDKLSEFIFGVRGKALSAQQPFGGATGFSSFLSMNKKNKQGLNDAEGLGYWLLYINAETGKLSFKHNGLK